MKINILKLSTFILILLFISTGCEKDEIEYADESIVVSSIPGISIYKTKKDYYNYISVQITDEGLINAIPDYSLDDPRIIIDKDGKATPNFRWRLKSGYIVDKETGRNEIFTDITIQEYIAYNIQNDVFGWPGELIRPRIIDKNPFYEYYYYNGFNKSEKQFTLKELNEMLENGTIEEYFTKLK